MVVGQGQIHHRPGDDLAFHHHGPLLNLVHAKDGALGRVEDGCGQQGAEDAAIGDGEGAAGEILETQGALLGLAAELGDALLDVRHAELVAVAQDGHHQAAGTANGNADVVVAVIDNVAAIHRGINDGETTQSLHRGLDEEGHEAHADVVGLLELLLILGAQVHDRLHVHLVEGGEDGGGLLRLDQPLGNPGAQSGHRHALLGTASLPPQGRGLNRGRRRQALGIGQGSTGLALIEVGDDIALMDAPALACAGNLRGVEVQFLDQPAGGGGQQGLAGGGGRRCRRCRGDRRLARRADPGENGGGGDGLAFTDQDLGQLAIGGCRHL